jgi:lipopolysaccharide export system protein LptC
MNDVRASNRAQLIILMLLAVALASGSSLWLLEVMRHGANGASSGAERTDPDYFVENFNFVRTSKLGQARYSISGVKLTHFPKEDSYQIDLPVVKSLSVDRPSITMRAQRALSNSDASNVQMFDNVQVDRPVSKFAPHFHLKSEYLQFFPDDDIMRSDKSVDITQGTTEIIGDDMLANNATLTFSLGRNVHAVIQPQKH